MVLCYLLAMDANGNGKKCVPKLRDILRRQRQDSDGGGGQECPDIEFEYADNDTHMNEIAEIYTYTENAEMNINMKAYDNLMFRNPYGGGHCWQKLNREQRCAFIMRLLDSLESSQISIRMRALRCILYLAQGCWAEVQCDREQVEFARQNVFLIYELGVFHVLIDLLCYEIDSVTKVALRKLLVTSADSLELRIILTILYIITEVMREEKTNPNSEYKNLVDSFVTDLAENTYGGGDLLAVKLLNMVTSFCSGACPHFPIKKVVLLLWKVILVSLGGIDTLRQLKKEVREKYGLEPFTEDSLEVTKHMRSSTPPASAADLLEAQQNSKRTARPFRRSLMKQSSLDENEYDGDEQCTEYDDERRTFDASNGDAMNNSRAGGGPSSGNDTRPPTPVTTEAPPLPIRNLPWVPKVRQKDIDLFLDSSRLKFLGYSLPEDHETLAGLPLPIHEGVKTLKRHMYTSLSEIQIQTEEEIARNPMSASEGEIIQTPTEILYQAILPNLPQYMIALLKVLLAAAPTSKSRSDTINIMNDVIPEEMPMTVVQSMELGIDIHRHKEIIVKGVSAILFLLLKHFKLNHVYQYEFISQHLVFANCIPLVLKFFNQDILGYVGSKNSIPMLDFPACVIGEHPELTTEAIEIGDSAAYSWRNMFSCINMLRILNKLTKWKHSRIMMLVVFKSAPILKRTLKVRHAMTQLYVLKLLKMQTKYLGRQWRKSNMKTISAIYAKVRHRLNDDWAFGNDLDARPWDFQAEECALRACVDRFNNRRYFNNKDSEYEPVDNNLASILGRVIELSDDFQKNYELWLQHEVHKSQIDWDQLIIKEGEKSVKNI
ncbi:striatin-interacting protein 1 homolog isoform X2 [Chrysoperla carnea]|uniref:striatin-interacting protein 1 homolog isoform X2 n=1 Tax=Chrysoperla carnea TaxID=189513 RepID=UPI001D06542D|nr:striatin-interacting protein 1 homolog isoform X2 [Chrysoperla carnea]